MRRWYRIDMVKRKHPNKGTRNWVCDFTDDPEEFERKVAEKWSDEPHGWERQSVRPAPEENPRRHELGMREQLRENRQFFEDQG